MTFGINKWATMVVKPLNFISPPNLVDPTFYLGFHPLPKTSQYTYLDIPFDESLEQKPIVSMLNSKLIIKLICLLTNKYVPLYLKTRILVSYVLFMYCHILCTTIWFNKSNTKKAQTALSFDFSSKSSNTTLKKTNQYFFFFFFKGSKYSLSYFIRIY